MSREILFRGKRLNNGEWVEGDGIHRPKSINYLGSCWIDGMGECANDWVQVDPATVGQYTGLCDKNGVKIFEGDIVGCWDIYHENYAKGEVIKKITGEWLFYPYLQHGRFWSLFSNDIGECPVEVIGNIHDNPELAIKNDGYCGLAGKAPAK